MQEVQQKLGIRRQPPEWKKQRNEAFLETRLQWRAGNSRR